MLLFIFWSGEMDFLFTFYFYVNHKYIWFNFLWIVNISQWCLTTWHICLLVIWFVWLYVVVALARALFVWKPNWKILKGNQFEHTKKQKKKQKKGLDKIMLCPWFGEFAHELMNQTSLFRGCKTLIQLFYL